MLFLLSWGRTPRGCWAGRWECRLRGFDSIDGMEAGYSWSSSFAHEASGAMHEVRSSGSVNERHIDQENIHIRLHNHRNACYNCRGNQNSLLLLPRCRRLATRETAEPRVDERKAPTKLRVYSGFIWILCPVCSASRGSYRTVL